MIIFVSTAMVVGIIALFFNSIAGVFGFSVYFWTIWLGWGGLILSVLMICGIAIEKIFEEVVSAILERLSLFRSTSESTTRAVINSGSKRMLQNFIAIGIIVVSGVITILGLSEGLSPPLVKEVNIKIEGLHPDLESFRIVQISDLHIGYSTRHNWVQQVVDQVNVLSPDVIAFTGDFADCDNWQIRKDVAHLTKLRAKYGSYFVTGNHDYVANAEGMKDLGFIVLQNEHRLIIQGHGSILLGGVDDYGAPFQSGHESSPAKAMGLNTKADVKILLAHQPDSIYEASQAGFDLQLSGHTHGGVISPVRWLLSLVQPFQSGLYKYKNTQIYVSNGTGYTGMPFRLGTPSEISLLKLTSG
jgi:uncharacterized protein